MAPLLAEKHRVWSYHRRGHGDSGDGADGSLEREVEDLAAVTAAAGPEVHLVGHSYGAVVCLKPAAHKPGLCSLVLYQPPLHPDTKLDAVGRGRELLDAGDLDAFLDLFLTEMAGGTDEDVAVLRSIPEV